MLSKNICLSPSRCQEQSGQADLLLSLTPDSHGTGMPLSLTGLMCSLAGSSGSSRSWATSRSPSLRLLGVLWGCLLSGICIFVPPGSREDAEAFIQGSAERRSRHGLAFRVERRGKGGRATCGGVGYGSGQWWIRVLDQLDCGLASTNAHVGSGRGGVARSGRFVLGGVRVRLVLPADR